MTSSQKYEKKYAKIESQKKNTIYERINIMSVININNENFNLINESNNPVLLDFYADWCGPCQMLSPIIHEIADARKDITVAKINVDENPELSQKFGVFSIPSLFVLKNGEIVEQSVGFRPKAAILRMLDK